MCAANPIQVSYSAKAVLFSSITINNERHNEARADRIYAVIIVSQDISRTRRAVVALSLQMFVA